MAALVRHVEKVNSFSRIRREGQVTNWYNSKIPFFARIPDGVFCVSKVEFSVIRLYCYFRLWFSAGFMLLTVRR
jgi:hypothetical protein